MGIEIIGTSHIAQESIEAVKKRIIELKPDIVALELDHRRAHALMHNQKQKLSPSLIKTVGFKGFIFLAIASFLQKKLGRIVGVEPGSEMKTALEQAIKANSKIALIDRRLEITIRRLTAAISWKERGRFILDLLTPFSKRSTSLAKIDLRKVPQEKLIETVISHLREKYPGVYRVLIEERNIHMAAALRDISKKHPDASILAIVGAGHEKEMKKMLIDKLAK